MGPQSFTVAYWVPLVMGLAFLILGSVLPNFTEVPWGLSVASCVAAAGLFVVAAYLAKTARFNTAIGGEGGSARVLGKGSSADGGDAGDGLGGGKGGDAEVIGDKSSARGGRGGSTT